MPLLRRIYNFTVTLGQTIRSMAVMIVYSRSVDRSVFQQTNHEAVVLASGPSLKQSLTEQLDFIRGRTVICTNNFIASPYFVQVKPEYYVFMDTAFWVKTTSPRQQELYRQYAQSMIDRVRWPMTIFLPQAARNWNYFIDVPKANQNISICYVNTTQVVSWPGLEFFFYRRQWAMPPMQNVIVAALYLAVNLGFTTTYLVGGDHSWHESLMVDNDNKLYLKNTGFQDDSERQLEPFYEDPAETRPYKMFNLLRDLSRMFYGYMIIEAYAKSRHQKILNASKKSFIDAFQRFALPHESIS